MVSVLFLNYITYQVVKVSQIKDVKDLAYGEAQK